MQPKAHLFVVDDDTMPIHIQKGFCGIVGTSGARNRRGNINSSYYSQLADVMNIKENDLVYFYMMTKNNNKFFSFLHADTFDKLEQGYYGIFRVTGAPFRSEERITGEYPFENYMIFGDDSNAGYSDYIRSDSGRTYGPPVLNLRIPIEPIEANNFFFNKFVDDNQAYIDKTDEGNLSTLLFKKIKRAGEERSITPILPEEASKIARLLFKQQNYRFPLNFSEQPVRNDNPELKVTLPLSSSDNCEFDSEAMLEAFILQCLNNGIELGAVEQYLGDRNEIEFCGNQVQYGISGNKVDILLLHKKQLAGSVSYRDKATVIELKKGKINKDAVKQIIDYQKWIAQLVTFNNLKAIQPILIGKKPGRINEDSKLQIREALNKIKNLEISEPLFFEYVIRNLERGEVDFVKFDIYEILDQ